MHHRILLISGAPAFAERLKAALHADALVMLADPLAGDAAPVAEQFQPDGVVFDGDGQLGVHTLFERASAVRKSFPGLPLIVTGNEMSAQLVLAAMRAGADDFLDSEASAADMRAVIVGRLDAPAPARQKNDRGALIGIASAAGGEEDQDFALNLSCLLAARLTPARVLLVDLSLPASIAPVALGVSVNFGLQEAIRAAARLDKALLDSVLARCPRSGLFVLPLAPQAETAEAALDVQDVHSLLHILRGLFDIVVIFYGPFSRQEQLADFARSDARLVLCCNQRLSSVKAASQWLQRLREMRPGTAAPHAAPLAVIHDFAPGLVPGAEAVRSALGAEECVILPVPWGDLAFAVNRGIPLALAGSSAYGRGIGACIDRLLPDSAFRARTEPVTAASSVKRLSRLFAHKRRA